MGYETIGVEERLGGQATEIILKPAPGNILTAKVMQEISACLREQEKIPAKKVIVFAGEGKHFCFGASVAEHLPEKVGEMLPAFHRFIGQILSFPVPTIAKVSGRCLGGGFELALACTFLFADAKALFAVPEIQLGVFPPPACILLPFRGGDALASQMILTGEGMDAAALHARGIVNHVSEEGKLDADVWGFVEKNLLPKSASSLKIATRSSRMMLSVLYEKHIGEIERLYLKDLMSTEDAVRGIQSFLEKRPPTWLNR